MSSRARFLFPIYMLILLAGSGMAIWASREAVAQPYDLEVVVTITSLTAIGAWIVSLLASHYAVGLFHWPRALSARFAYSFLIAMVGYFLCFGALSYAIVGGVDHSRINSYSDLSTFSTAGSERVIGVGNLTLNGSGIATKAVTHRPRGKARAFKHPDTTVYCAIPIVRSADAPTQVDGWLLLEKPYAEYTQLAATGQLDKLVDFSTVKLLAPVPDLNSDKRYGPLARQSPAYNNETARKPGFYILRVLPPDSRRMRWYIFAGIALFAGGAIYLSTRLIANAAKTFNQTQ